MERSSNIFPAIPLQERHNRAESPALSPKYFPVARAEFTICSFLRRMVLRLPVEQECRTSTKGKSEAQSKRKSPIILSWAPLPLKVSPKGMSPSWASRRPSRLKSGCILCQVRSSISQGHEFFLVEHLAKKTPLPVFPPVFLGKDHD